MRPRLNTAANSITPAAVDDSIDIGDDVLTYKDQFVGKRAGPLRVVGIDEKAIVIKNDGKLNRILLDRCKK